MSSICTPRVTGTAVDYTVNAGVGVPDMTGPEAATGPVNQVMPLWDLLTGATAAIGVLAAVRERDRTGSGAFIELALGDVAMSGVANLWWLADAQLGGADRERLGNHVYGSFGVDFATADDGRVMVVALTEKQWRALCTVTGTDEVFAALEKALCADLSDQAERYRLRETIAAILRPWFAARTLADVAGELDAAHVLWGPYRTVRQLVEHVRAATDSVITTIEQPGVGRVMTSLSPLRWHGRAPHVAAAPLLGADTAEC
jgi:2-methylfumaryl-CoA isomerase